MSTSERPADPVHTSHRVFLDASGTEDSDFFKQIQKSINSNRKVESRIRRVTEDLEKKHVQWRNFEKHLQHAYLTQKQKYQADVDNLTREAQELTSQKAQTLKQLLDTVETRDAPPALDAGMQVPARTDQEAWSALIGEADRQADHNLAQALFAAQDPASFASLVRAQLGQVPPDARVPPTPRPAHPVPRTPSHPAILAQMVPVAAATPACHVSPPRYAMGSSPPPAATDPYQASTPVLGPAVPSVPAVALAPAQTARPLTPRPRSAFGKTGDRVPVKTATKGSLPATVTQCLQAAQCAREEALERRRDWGRASDHLSQRSGTRQA